MIHLAETKTENDDSLAKRKMTPTAALDAMGVLTGWTVAAHGVWLDDADLKILKARGTGLVAQPVEQYETGERRRAGGEDSGPGHSRWGWEPTASRVRITITT